MESEFVLLSPLIKPIGERVWVMRNNEFTNQIEQATKMKFDATRHQAPTSER